MAFGMNNKLRINTALVAFMLLLLLLFIVVYIADDGKHYIWLTLKLILYLLIMFMIYLIVKNFFKLSPSIIYNMTFFFFFLSLTPIYIGTGTGGVNDKVASLVEDEAAKTKTTKTKTRQERGEDLDLLVMDYTPARKKSPIHN
ncbi:hypothetical protein PRUPE_5G236600 [Prunus persica]|uniref:Uncharacterized protein n=1 Tax=Prunus persica TaxID=3760 RepID=A0A251PCX1_PRUPE|nr:hypothetical protein PRUPE_5G236600 [Prunus persica]